MPHTTVAWGTFPTRKSADQAISRLISNGFARNSIDLQRHDDDDGYDVAVHTREDNLERVERLIHTSVPAYALQQFGSSAIRNAKSHPMALLAAGVAAGVVLFGVMRDRRR
jgi:hypothetical protein